MASAQNNQNEEPESHSKGASSQPAMATTISTTTNPPTRQIRARFDTETITVYQAYNSAIASAALSAQRLDASPLYRPSRATWIKPSWTWMMYRSGYSFKDANQERILALHMTHADFISLLRGATLAKESHEKGQGVVVQWDPERGARLEKHEWRSIQIGIMGRAREEWIKEGIVRIEDVTEQARELRRVLDEEGESVTEDQLVERGLLMRERVYEVPEDVMLKLGMD